MEANKDVNTSISKNSLSAGQFFLLLVAYAFIYALCFKLAAYMHGLAQFSLWYPAAGMRFALIFLFGWRFGLSAIFAEAAAQYALGFWGEYLDNPLEIVLGAIGPGLMYTLLLSSLDQLRYTSAKLTNLSQIVWFCLAAVITPALAAPVMTLHAIINNRLPASQFYDATLSFWIGDLIGILMIAPLTLLIIVAVSERTFSLFKPLKNWYFLTEFIIAIFCCWWIFTVMGTNSFSLRWFPLFVPVLIIAYRYGFAASAVMTLVLNILAFFPASAMSVEARFELEAFLALVSFMGLLFGGTASSRLTAQSIISEQQKTLSQINRHQSIEGLAAHIIHELTQPISSTGIYSSGAVKMLQDGLLDKHELIEVLNIIKRESDRSVEQINRIKAFLRDGELQMRPTTVQAIIEDARHLLDLTAREGGATITYNLPTTDLRLLADSIQLQQALLNLVKNSVEAMEDSTEKRITLAAGRTGNNRLYIAVTDTGPGFPDHLVIGTTTKPGGMGLGLKIVQKIMDAHNGTLSCQGQTAQLTL